MANGYLDQSATIRQQEQQQKQRAQPTRSSSAPPQDVFMSPPPPTPPHIVGISRAPTYTTLTAGCQDNFTHLLGASFQPLAATIEGNDAYVHQTTPTNSGLNTPSLTRPPRAGMPTYNQNSISASFLILKTMLLVHSSSEMTYIVITLMTT